jgi:protein involved in polysaccharide export with SLBB domain
VAASLLPAAGIAQSQNSGGNFGYGGNTGGNSNYGNYGNSGNAGNYGNNNQGGYTNYGNGNYPIVGPQGPTGPNGQPIQQGNGSNQRQGMGSATMLQQPNLPPNVFGQQNLPQGQFPPVFPVYVPTEFEIYVQSLLLPDAMPIHRLGAELMTPSVAPSLTGLPEPSPVVPDDYLVVPGDTLHVSAWGSVDADLLLVVDRGGRIVIPHVGAVTVAGVRAADLAATIKKQAARTYRNFDVSASVALLRSIQVYVTGFVAHPGVYSVSNLSTLSTALVQAGGPSAAGSYRAIQVIRRGQAPIEYDLYDLAIRGNRNSDVILQPDDVIHVGPIGAEVAVLGSVNQPAVVELKGSETITDVLALVGGYSSVADRGNVTVEHLGDRTSTGVAHIEMPAGGSQPVQRGDILRVFSAVAASSPIANHNRLVVVEGEVDHPGQYLLPPGSSLQDALQAAGGLTPKAYVFGTELTRERVRKEQEANQDRALRDLDADLTRNAATRRTATAQDAAALSAKDSAIQRLVANLRMVRPTGRVVLQMAPDAKELPPLALENGDRVNIPAVPTSISVFGSVFSSSSFVFSPGRTLSEYISLAGGPKRGADADSTFVIRSNGSVVSDLQGKSWFKSGSLMQTAALPGDTIFVPEEMDKTTLTEDLKDWSQIIYQLGLGVAAAYAVTK